MKARNLTERIKDALADTPVVFLAGGRQTGKSTLALELGGASQITLDSTTALAAAHSDPEGFIASFPGLIMIDEVQRAPELFLAIKRSVDLDRRPGRFLLTGSANPLLLPRASESLAGRMEICTLYGFTQGELEGRREDFVDRLFQDEPMASLIDLDGPTIAERACRGGFPEVALHRPRASRRAAWFDSYVDSFIQRDLRDLAQITGALELPSILRLLATRVSQPLNIADISRQTTVRPTTLRRYLAILEATYFVGEIPPWTVNLGKRVTKAPKVLIHDSGLLCHLLGLSPQRFEREPVLFGPVLESFVANEFLRQLSWAEVSAKLFHFRAHSGEEVDLVLEASDGRVVGIEVKSSASLGHSDWRGLKFMREQLGNRFHRGIVLYRGKERVGLADRLEALPISALWSV